MQKRKLQAIIDYVVQATVACLLMMWGFSNFSAAMRTLADPGSELAFPAGDANWIATAAMLVVTAGVPFGFGLWMLARLIRQTR